MRPDIAVCGTVDFEQQIRVAIGDLCGTIRGWRSAAQCRKRLAGSSAPSLVLVGPHNEDVTPINLVAALRADERGLARPSKRRIILFTDGEVSGSLSSRGRTAGASQIVSLKDCVSCDELRRSILPLEVAGLELASGQLAGDAQQSRAAGAGQVQGYPPLPAMAPNRVVTSAGSVMPSGDPSVSMPPVADDAEAVGLTTSLPAVRDAGMPDADGARERIEGAEGYGFEEQADNVGEQAVVDGERVLSGSELLEARVPQVHHPDVRACVAHESLMADDGEFLDRLLEDVLDGETGLAGVPVVEQASSASGEEGDVQEEPAFKAEVRISGQSAAVISQQVGGQLQAQVPQPSMMPMQVGVAESEQVGTLGSPQTGEGPSRSEDACGGASRDGRGQELQVAAPSEEHAPSPAALWAARQADLIAADLAAAQAGKERDRSLGNGVPGWIPQTASRSDGTSEPTEGGGFALAVMSGSGGVGKSVISVLSALELAHRGLRCALVDFDLQFGDLAFLFGVENCRGIDELLFAARSPTALAAQLPTVGVEVRDGVTLFACPRQPEHGDAVLPHAGAIISAMRTAYDAVVVNSGSFWSDAHAQLACVADVCLLVMDQRVSSIHAGARAYDLCGRLGVPRAHIACLLNRFDPHGSVTPADVSPAFHGAPFCAIADGRREVEELMGTGTPEQLLSLRNPCATDVSDMLDTVLRPRGFLPEKTRKRRLIPESRHIATFGRSGLRSR